MEAAVDHVVATVSGDIVLGIPLGIGKPNVFVNALYRRIKATPARRLRIVTALSLEKPVGHSDLERHFLAPLVERVFADYPDLDYVKDSRAGSLPPNITVREFFMKTADYLGNTAAQLGYISTNYTFVARDMALQGMNVMAQAVASNKVQGEQVLSLSSNPDITFELVEAMRTTGQPLLTVAVLNSHMPFMPNGAQAPAHFFDVVVDDPAASHTLFAPPNAKITTADYAIGLHASSFVQDGGTLQIGIGSLGDAIGQALIVRDRHGAQYHSLLQSLSIDGLAGRSLGKFEEGLYGCSEMFVNAFMRLMDAGIVRRAVYADAALQMACNQGLARVGGVDGMVSPALLQGLVAAGRLSKGCIAADDLAYLQHFGILHPLVVLETPPSSLSGSEGSVLRLGAHACSANLHDPAALAEVCQHMLGTHLLHGTVMTGGFFLGPTDFYQRLRDMPARDMAKIDMNRIDFINQLYGDEALKRAQRVKAAFINTTMVVTLLGAAASDTLESGQVVSGVGGQYNFVAMAHALPDARLLMLLRSTHEHKNGLKSNIVWNYGNVTIPRHLRDVVITEYGVADLRGQVDSEVVKRLVAVADSRFQDALIAQAQQSGKLEPDYVLPERYRHNLPEVLQQKLQPFKDSNLLPDFPFGTDLTEDELHMVRALKKTKHASEHPIEMLLQLVHSLWAGKDAPPAYLERLGLADAHSFKDLLVRRLFAGNL